MKILVLSDSHGSKWYMEKCIRVVKPDAVIHLGDYYEDGQDMAEKFSHIPFHQVPGNCDRNRMLRYVPDILIYPVCGVELYMTHGHVPHDVKYGSAKLLQEVRKTRAKALLYGHTHQAVCRQEEDGLWVLNPGKAGHSAGLIETENGKIRSCRILEQNDLEEYL